MGKSEIYKILVGLVSFLSLTACSDWLDIQPQDTITEEDLFKNGDGYRNALNGIYSQMAKSSMYGKALMWGELDAMAQYYRTSTGTNEEYFSKYQYTGSHIYPVIQSIWSNAYNCIANCNNLIQRLETASPVIFKNGEEEKKLIKGEALALRAFLHFDLFRLFSSAKVDDDKKYIPYVDEYPVTFKEYVTNKEILEKATEDLLEAKDLVGQFDLPRVSWLRIDARFKNNTQGIPVDERPDDLFLSYRGYRMNYYAICGELARVYLYRGMYKEAFEETETIINAEVDEYGTAAFSFTPSYYIEYYGNNKLFNELIFCLSNQKLVEDVRDYRVSEPLYFKGNPMSDWFNGDKSDARCKLVKLKDYYYYNGKYEEVDGSDFQYAKDMVPMMRLGEMYLIRAEYYAHKGMEKEMLDELTTLRQGHGASTGAQIEGKAEQTILNEARREFMGEGQLFYYYKHFGIRPSGMSSDDLFILPYPENEVL